MLSQAESRMFSPGSWYLDTLREHADWTVLTLLRWTEAGRVDNMWLVRNGYVKGNLLYGWLVEPLAGRDSLVYSSYLVPPMALGV